MTRYQLTIMTLTVALMGIFIFSLYYSLPQKIHVGQGLKSLLLHRESVSALVIGQLRLPRILLALLIGCALGLSGANLQAVMRNPLADPGVLGITSCASLGAVLVFYTGLLAEISWGTTIAAFTGALGAALVLLSLSRKGMTLVILSGIALNTMSIALLSLILNLVPSPYARFEMTHWLLGSLNQVDLQDFFIAAPGLIIGSLLLLATRRQLDGLSLGDDVAYSMGITPHYTQCLIIGGCALSLGSAVSVAGNIAFIGLVVPHIVRFLVGYKASHTLLPSALMGACLLVGADNITRLPFLGSNLPLGVVTTLVGTPFFLFQIGKLHREHNV